ncbi:hypothetical protein K458DRAFT_36738 [Lentithecium fluviatile CBS 122367]|uniref:Uncharacterized protein n=1 Tax=Lentithecium fluviatile CBS 122367 TaxID=1168545 RepID=A0A6G1J0M3_9PLEO|nr:hypothetical protein K458DRAFT_36738 [Lentithecium fluviatile CBS 122367]
MKMRNRIEADSVFACLLVSLDQANPDREKKRWLAEVCISGPCKSSCTYRFVLPISSPISLHLRKVAGWLALRQNCE